MTADGTRGRIVAAYGRNVLLEDDSGMRGHSKLRGKRLRPVCGDWVTWTLEATGGERIVEEIQPRKTELTRPDNRGRPEVIASNVTQLIVVVAAKPEYDLFMIDRYLAAARFMDADAAIVLNKQDLDGADKLNSDMQEFKDIGYRIVRTCAKTGTGIDILEKLLGEQTSILVGQSGVGTSSLLNKMIPGIDAATREISESGGFGKHTTTASILHHVPNNGEIIDSPGVRDFAPTPQEPRLIAHGYREMAPLMHDCRYSDCMHLKEPGCAIKNAVEQGDITQRRYESYSRLVALMDRLSKDDY